MRRALGRGWWALSITAGLTLILPASAQPPARMPAGPAWPTTPGKAQAAGEDSNRLAEIAVELGWLADPVCFPYHFAARADGDNLEIRGVVPNAAVRDRILKVARQEGRLKVVDHLKVNPNASSHPVSVPIDELLRSAQETLRTSFPKQVAKIEVGCRTYGQMVLTGVIPTFEEKLAISQSLRRLPGCTSVVNQLAVGSVVTEVPRGAPKSPLENPRGLFGAMLPHGPASTAAVTAAPVAGPELTPAPAPVTVPTPSRPPTVAAAPPVKARPPQPVLQTPAQPVVKSTVPPGPTAASPYAANTVTAPPRPQPVTTAQPTAMSLVSPYAPSTPTPPAPVAPKTAAAAVRTPLLPVLDRTAERPAPAIPATPARNSSLAPAWQTAAGTRDSTTGTASPKAIAQAQYLAPMPSPAVSTAPAPRPMTPAVAQVVPKPLPTVSPPAVVSHKIEEPMVVAQATPKPRLVYPVPAEPYETTGKVILVDRDFHAAAAPTVSVAPAAPAVIPPARKVIPQARRASEGPLAGASGLGEDLPRRSNTAPPAAPAFSPDLPARLRQAVQGACGALARDVEIVFPSPDKVIVKLRVNSRADANEVGPRIANLAELAPYEPQVEIKLRE